MKRAVLPCLLLVTLALSGCSGSVTAPDDPRLTGESPVEFATISGQVYANLAWADPPIADAVIAVTSVDGAEQIAVSDAGGFYHVTVRPGGVTISALKDGFQTTRSRFTVSSHTVLNFGLDPL